MKYLLEVALIFIAIILFSTPFLAHDNFKKNENSTNLLILNNQVEQIKSGALTYQQKYKKELRNIEELIETNIFLKPAVYQNAYWKIDNNKVQLSKSVDEDLCSLININSNINNKLNLSCKIEHNTVYFYLN